MLQRRLFNIAALVLLLLLVVTSAQAQLAGACADPAYAGSRLVGGSYARVLPGEPNNVRETPSASATLVAQIEPGQVVYITSAPVCAEGYVWWQVMYRTPESTEDFPFGYTVEGAAPLGEGNYWLEPAPQPLNVPSVTTPITGASVGQLQQVAQVEFGMVNRFAWSADNKRLAINTVGATWVYDLSSGSLPVRITANSYDTNYTQGIALGADGDSVATAGSITLDANAPQAGVAYTWSLANPVSPQVSFLHADAPFGGVAAVSPDSRLVAFANGDGSISVRDMFTSDPVSTMQGHTLVGSLTFSPDGTRLVSAGTGGMMVSDTTVRVWDVATGTELGMFDLGELTPVLVLDAAGTTIAVVTYNIESGSQAVQLIDMASLTVSGSISVPAGSIAGLAFSPDGSLLAVSNSLFDDAQGGWASALRFYDRSTGAEVFAVSFNSGVGTVSFSPDGTLLALMYEDPLFWGPNRATLWAVQ